MRIAHWISWALFAGADLLVLAEGAKLAFGSHWDPPRRNSLPYTLPVALVLSVACVLTQTL